jgi:hypothetical protein
VQPRVFLGAGVCVLAYYALEFAIWVQFARYGQAAGGTGFLLDGLGLQSGLLPIFLVLVLLLGSTDLLEWGEITVRWVVVKAGPVWPPWLLGKRFEDFRFLIRDRGSSFTSSFDAVFQAADASVLRTAVQAPRMNAICERLVGTLRRELLDHSLILGEAHLRAVLAEYQEHYNTARPHQGIDERIPAREHHPPRVTAGAFRIRQIRRKPVLSGLINEYVRTARDSRRHRSQARLLFSSGTGADVAATSRALQNSPLGRQRQPCHEIITRRRSIDQCEPRARPSPPLGIRLTGFG